LRPLLARPEQIAEYAPDQGRLPGKSDADIACHPALFIKLARSGSATASHAQEPQFPPVGPIRIDVAKHRLWFGCREPFRFGHDRHSLPSTKSTTQQPRTCGPSPRQWSRMSAFSHPASCSASDRIGMSEKSRDSYMDPASETTVDVRHSGSMETGQNGLP